MEDEHPYEITFVRLFEGLSVSHEPAEAAIVAALRRHGVEQAKVTVVLVDDQRIAELNKTYLDHSGPTDVLTFDLADEPSPPEQGDAISDSAASGFVKLDGEIIVSAETAAREAQDRGISVDAEVALYAVHGALHLLGYEDGLADEASRMHELEDEILGEVGIGSVFRRGCP